MKCDDEISDGQIVFSISVPQLPRASSPKTKLNNSLDDHSSETESAREPNAVKKDHSEQQQQLGEQKDYIQQQQQQHHQQLEEPKDYLQQQQKHHQQLGEQKDYHQQQQQKHHQQQQQQRLEQSQLDNCQNDEQPIRRKSKLKKKQLSWSCEDVRIFEVPPAPPPDKSEPEKGEGDHRKVKT